jgi:uncharacterized damage-inducible protein DinB
MDRRPVLVALALLCLTVAPCLLAGEQAAAPAAMKSMPTFQAMVVSELDAVEKKVVALAEAVPQEKYDWRPADGVRSVAEAYMHIAQGNYYLAMLAGTPPPEGIDLQTYDKASTTKKDVVAALHASYDHARKMTQGLTDADLAKEVDFFGQKKSVRDLLLISLEHNHEHLGQEIAYARTNGVKPPWSE